MGNIMCLLNTEVCKCFTIGAQNKSKEPESEHISTFRKTNIPELNLNDLRRGAPFQYFVLVNSHIDHIYTHRMCVDTLGMFLHFAKHVAYTLIMHI